MEPGRALEAAALLVAAASAGWAAASCRSASRAGRQAGDARVWAGVSALFLLLALARVAQAGPWLGGTLRQLARGFRVYGDRRPLQIAVTVGLAIFALAALAVGLRSLWDFVRRYRLAAASVAITVSLALIRFVSLHEVDAWDNAWPWARVVIDLATSLLASAAAFARVRQLGDSQDEIPAG